MIDEEPTATIHAPDITETAVLKQPLALAAGDCPAVIETGPDRDVDIQSLSRNGRREGRTKGNGKTKGKEFSFHGLSSRVKLAGCQFR
ncbi:hypothetical protein SLT36_19435 [Aminobacter sp. BA135]|uniref:hypothetical protein n=1 Tax=Aminobacter sp. BA135 TaxID=537596 RepID=UPI003D78C6C7